MGSEESKHQKHSSHLQTLEIMHSIPEGCTYVRPLVVVGHPGVGRSTLINHLMKHFGDKMVRIVSVTDRLPHEHEVNGVDFIFETKAEFKRQHAEGKFFEHDVVHGDLYGL